MKTDTSEAETAPAKGGSGGDRVSRCGGVGRR